MSLLSFRTVLRRAGSRSHFLGAMRAGAPSQPKGKTASRHAREPLSPKIIGCESRIPPLGLGHSRASCSQSQTWSTRVSISTMNTATKLTCGSREMRNNITRSMFNMRHLVRCYPKKSETLPVDPVIGCLLLKILRVQRRRVLRRGQRLRLLRLDQPR